MRILGIVVFTFFVGSLVCGAGITLARLALDGTGVSNTTRSVLSLALMAGSYLLAGWAGVKIFRKRKPSTP
jgi:hypothetical protein